MTIWGNQLHQFNHRSEVNIQKYFHINATNHPKCVQKMYLMCFLHIIHWQKIYWPIWGNWEIWPVFRDTCQLLVSRLRAENFNLLPTHAYGPNSHAWMKNVSYNGLNWDTFLKDINLHQFKKRKLHVIEKVNEYWTALTRNCWYLWFLTRKVLGTRSCLAKHLPGLGLRDVQDCFRFHYCMQIWS